MAGESPLPVAAAVMLEVTADEDGMKLLRFLERRLTRPVPGAALHKWIRSGQVRVNSGRTGPFSRLAVGDLVRFPPFAQVRILNAPPDSSAPSPAADGREASAPPALSRMPDVLQGIGPDIQVVARTPNLLVLGKPAALPCQPGSGHEDSLCARLAAAFAGSPFIPAPAHRIDRHSSGLVLIGLRQAAQQRLHALFASNQIHKDYLAWVAGDWTPPGPCLLEDRLVTHSAAGWEGMAALPGGRLLPLPENTKKNGGPAWSPFAAGNAGSGVAVSAVLAVQTLSASELPRSVCRDGGPRVPARTLISRSIWSAPPPCATLLLLRLMTGRRHQLRVQLASRGYPVIGDGRYGAVPFTRMLLHAFALSLPADGLCEASRMTRPDGVPAADGQSRRQDADAAAHRPETASPADGERLEFRLPPSWPPPFAPDPALLAPARQRLEQFHFERIAANQRFPSMDNASTLL